MDRQRRTSLVGGLFLVLLGAWFLAVQVFPGLRLWSGFSWPIIVVAVGVLVLVLGLLSGEPGMAVPATIVTGIGLLLYWQNSTGDWGSWAYAWTLIPGFAGLGTLLAGALGDKPQVSFREGTRMILVSAVLFVIFASFLGGRDLVGPYWPVALILLGLFVLGQSLFQGFRKS